MAVYWHIFNSLPKERKETEYIIDVCTKKRKRQLKKNEMPRKKERRKKKMWRVE